MEPNHLTVSQTNWNKPDIFGKQNRNVIVIGLNRIASCFICIFNVSYPWLSIEMRIASASVMEMYIPNVYLYIYIYIYIYTPPPQYVIYFCDSKAEFFCIITAVFSITRSFWNHYNMLICFLKNISCYYQCWKKVVLPNIHVKNNSKYVFFYIYDYKTINKHWGL